MIPKSQSFSKKSLSRLFFEKVIGVDLPDETIEKIVDGVKAKIGIDSASDALGKLKNLF